TRGLDEVDALSLVGWRQTASATAAHDATAGDARTAGLARPERASLERGHPLAAQQARQLHPLHAANPRTAVTQLRGHRFVPYRLSLTVTVGHSSSSPLYWNRVERVWSARRSVSPAPC